MSSPDPEAPSDAPEADAPSPEPPGAPKNVVTKALLRYRTLAWATGIWLLVLCTEMVLKYIVGIDYPWFKWIGILHGAFYMLYVFFTFDLAIKVRWPIGKTIGVLLAGTIPLLGIIVEHFQTKQIKATHNL
jgi:integral membrane protein